MNMDDHSQYSAPRIMMIDDELSNLQIVKLILTRENFSSDLVMFSSGREALEYLRANSVDLILLDLAMPDMTGFDVMTRLRENHATADIPVIFLSAYQDTEYILRAFELGATDFIGKPIISPILMARIQHLIESRRLQGALRKSNDELVNINRLKDELLSICSHDLRAPLSAIELICQFLTDSVGGRSEQSPAELINRIVAQSRLARRLVENLLDLNRIEEGRLIPSPSFFSVAELVHDCGGDELPALEARGLKLETKLPPADVLCFGDREMLSQVLHNLLNNAAKFARDRIVMSAEGADITAEQGGRLRLAVADDGRGIPEAQRQVVFEKYAKLEVQGGGSGLGLYISRQMVELHHGQIAIQSQAGPGTQFVIMLPNVFRADQLPELSSLHRRRVVVVSASRPTAQLLESVLVEAGMIEVTQVGDEAALEGAMQPAQPDLVVLDGQAGALGQKLLALCAADAVAAVPRWVVFGEGPGHDAVNAAVSGAVLIGAPLNPLVYLRAVRDLLQSGVTSRVMAQG